MNHISDKEIELASDETGAAMKIVCMEEEITVNAVAEDSVADLLLANAKILAVGGKVTAAITGGDGTGSSVGDPTTAGRFATGLARTVGANFLTVVADSAAAQAAAAKIRITATGGTPTAPTAGKIRISVWQLVFTGPTT